MKKGIKAILALCFLSVFGMFFMPLIEVSDAEMSVFDILKISVQSGASDSVEIINDLQTVIGTSMMQFIIMYGILVALVLIAVVLVTMLKGKTAYFSSIGMSLGINVYTSVTTLLLISKLKTFLWHWYNYFYRRINNCYLGNDHYSYYLIICFRFNV